MMESWQQTKIKAGEKPGKTLGNYCDGTGHHLTHRYPASRIFGGGNSKQTGFGKMRIQFHELCGIEMRLWYSLQ